MKKLFFGLLFLGLCFTMSAQSQPEVGDELIVKESSAYNYVKFPKLNVLTKRGKVANYKSVYGNTVLVDEVITKDDGSTYVILKKKDGSKFFGYLTKVKANYSKSIDAGELASAKS
jgi:hypothetical protein